MRYAGVEGLLIVRFDFLSGDGAVFIRYGVRLYILFMIFPIY